MGRFLFSGVILAATAFILRALGVGFNAFLSRELGTDGMGLFTLIMSLYGLAVTVASSGVNLASARMCTEALSHPGGEDLLAASLKRCLLYALVCGGGAAILLFAGAEMIAVHWLGDGRCTLALRLLALSLPFIAGSNVLNGYFTAVRRAYKSAAAQIFEQLLKMAVTAWLLLHAIPEKSGAAVEYACAAIVGGGALAEIGSFLLTALLYRIERAKRKPGILHAGQGILLTKKLLGIAVPVAAAAYIRSGLSTLEHILIPRGLRKNPLTADTALAAYGMLCGMAMPVIFFPTAVLYSFTGLLIPEFTEAHARGEKKRIGRMITRAVWGTLIFSGICMAVMTAFGEKIGILLYDSVEAGRYIAIMAPLVPVMYLDHAVDAMLKGLNEQLYSMKVNIFDAALCTLMVWQLCPRIGIWGYIITVYLSEAINALLSLHRLWRVVRCEGDRPQKKAIPRDASRPSQPHIPAPPPIPRGKRHARHT